MVPTVVERSGRLDLARGPRIISLVLEAFNCMSLLSVHLSKLIKQESRAAARKPRDAASVLFR